MSEVNLKGNTDELVYYRQLNTGNKIARKRIKKGKEEVYYVAETEEKIWTEEQIKNFSLDKFGTHIPYIEGHYTILNNYFFDFWGYFLGAEGIALYAHLTRYAYGSKDFCFPSLQTIAKKMDKTPVTVRGYLKLLERYGFIWKVNVRNKTKDNTEESPIFKIRRKVPLLSEELLNGNPNIEIPNDEEAHVKKALKKEKEGLPKVLKKEHDEFVKKMMDESETINIPEALQYDTMYEDILSKGEIRKEIKKQIPNPPTSFESISMTTEEEKVDSTLKSELQNRVSKPSFDTWFKNTKIKIENDNCLLLVPNEYAFDWIKQRYLETIKTVLEEAGYVFEKIELRKVQ
ncbi:DnaA N-terminal domain-containing protein [Bacillus halotolerans]|uniref:DnaA N-terminal domain-containing protein n=1 Tax=Bacillus halotolerans TaxID=260554 RepID=UPI004049CC50